MCLAQERTTSHRIPMEKTPTLQKCKCYPFTLWRSDCNSMAPVTYSCMIRESGLPES